MEHAMTRCDESRGNRTGLVYGAVLVVLAVTSTTEAQPADPAPTSPVAARLQGPWLGQTPPGEDPVPFASGLLTATPLFSPDGREAYWTRGTGPFQSVIVVSRLAGDGWTEPAPLPFSRPELMDHNPALSPDGSFLVFAASRPTSTRPRTFIGGSPMPASDLWMTTRGTDGAWAEPALLGAGVNTEFDEDCPRIAADGTIYFTSARPVADGYAGICRVRRVDGRYGEPEILPAPVHSGAGELVELVAPDQSYLVFRSMRPGGYGRADVYVAHRAGNGRDWTTPANLGKAFNVPRRWALVLSPDARFLFYTSDATGKPGVYWVAAPKLDSPAPLSAVRATAAPAVGTPSGPPTRH